MQRVSMRTLVLLLELLAAVVAFQYLAAVRTAKADAVWLAGDCSAGPSSTAEPTEPPAVP
jgi:hypothetical protein